MTGENIMVALIVLGAVLFIAKNAWHLLYPKQNSSGRCGAGCGTCSQNTSSQGEGPANAQGFVPLEALSSTLPARKPLPR